MNNVEKLSKIDRQLKKICDDLFKNEPRTFSMSNKEFNEFDNLIAELFEVRRHIGFAITAQVKYERAKKN